MRHGKANELGYIQTPSSDAPTVREAKAGRQEPQDPYFFGKTGMKRTDGATYFHHPTDGKKNSGHAETQKKGLGKYGAQKGGNSFPYKGTSGGGGTAKTGNAATQVKSRGKV